MLNVWTILWGDKYAKDYVYRLKWMVKQHLVRPHRFRCITDQQLPGIETVKPVCDYHGWWQKIGLFKPGLTSGFNLWLDLDVTIVGNLDWICRYERKNLAAPWNWAQSGHGGVQSSVMVWDECPEIWERFDYKRDSERLWGDQEFITELRDQGVIKVDQMPPERVVSYKYHCRHHLPGGSSVVCFHGKPDPHEVRDTWVKSTFTPIPDYMDSLATGEHSQKSPAAA